MSEKSTSQSPQIHNYVGETWVPKIKRRRRFSAEETKILERAYDKNSSPNQEKIQDIANVISTPRKIVTTWFQNRRAKNKRKERARTEEGESSSQDKRSVRTYHDYNEDDNVYNDEVIVPENNEECTPIINSNDNRCNSQYTPEIDPIKNVVDLPMYNSTLTTSPIVNYSNNTRNCTQTPLIIDTNQQYIFPQNNQYFSLPQINQPYSINIYNNMNNYLNSQEQYETNITNSSSSRGTRNIFDLNQETWYNYIYYQQYPNDTCSLFNSNNNTFRNNNFPFIMNNFSTVNNETNQICINPTDIYLNSNLPKEE